MLGKALLTAATGMMAGGEALGVEDVFSTSLYTGNGSTQTITNGIDLAGEGGAVWVKSRSGNRDHVFVDNNNVGSGFLKVNGIDGLLSSSTAVNLFNSDGFRIGNNANVNFSGDTLVSWTFRKAPKFFGIVTYTGTGSARTIAHNLGSVPGCIIVKRTDTSADWFVYHRSTGAFNALSLNTTDAAFGNNNYWNNTAPTSSVFSVGIDARCNANGGTYVAYVFAHDAGGFGDDGNQNVISCGSVTTNGSGQIPDVNLGWEPQWLIMKNATSAGNWDIYDTMRGWVSKDQNQFNRLSANVSNSEAVDVNGPAVITSTGFRSNTLNFGAGQTYIYIAIRRGPMKTPTAGTDVFGAYTFTSPQTFTLPTGWAPDLVTRLQRNLDDSFARLFGTRLQGKNVFLATDSSVAENTSNTVFTFDKTGGQASAEYGGSGVNLVSYGIRRAPGFFDVVAYTGTGSAQSIAHNLGVAPELMIVKNRSASAAWNVYAAQLGATQVLFLSGSQAAATSSGAWNNTSPNSSLFTVGPNNSASSNTYIAYLFATLPGVSKVGSYTGTGTALDIDCGFTNGARFVLIKRTDSSGGWFVWDAARGIVSGNDPYLLLNSSVAEVTGTDFLDPLPSGFSVPANGLSFGTFIFLAIA